MDWILDDDCEEMSLTPVLFTADSRKKKTAKKKNRKEKSETNIREIGNEHFFFFRLYWMADPLAGEIDLSP